MICSQEKKRESQVVCYKILFQYLPGLLNPPTPWGAQIDSYISL